MSNIIVRSGDERVIFPLNGEKYLEVKMPTFGWCRDEGFSISTAFLRLSEDLEPIISAYMAWRA